MKIDTINFKDLKKLTKKHGNDADLGEAIRKLIQDFDDKKYEKE